MADGVDIDFRTAMDRIGKYLREKARSRFRDQSFAGEEWDERAVPNIAGIISDFQERGRTPGGIPKRRFDPRPALIDTGELRKSIDYRVEDDGTTVTVGTNLPYAQKMQEGGVSRFDIDQATGAKLKRLATTAKVKNLDDAERVARRLESVAEMDTFEVEIPPRTFLGIDEEDEEEIVSIFERSINL